MSGYLAWAPDARAPLCVRARWVGAPGVHTIHWGDGTTDRVTAWQGARQHTYSTPGPYTVTATGGASAVAAVVVVRSTLEPAARAEAAEGNQVRVSLPDTPPLDWSIDWGDGTTSRHTGTRAEHTYPWGHGATKITVTDIGSRRLSRLTGPSIGAQPPTPLPDDGLLRAGFWWDHTGGRGGVLRGGGCLPGSEVRVFWRAGASDSGQQVVTADRFGQVALERTFAAPITSDFDVWRSTKVEYTSTEGAPRTRYVPVHVPRAQAGRRDVVYDWDDIEASRVYATVTGPPRAGVYRIDWGDGQRTQVDAVVWPLRVPHVYNGADPRTITVTTPDGATLTQTVRPTHVCRVSYNPNYPGTVYALWTGPVDGVACTSSSGYAPVRISSGEHGAQQYHCPDNRTGWQVVYSFRFSSPGRKRIRQSTALAAERVTDVDVTAVSRQNPATPDGQPHHLPDTPLPPLPVPQFHVGERGTGWYKGWFDIDNPTDQPRTFALAFDLGAPAVLAEVASWRGEARHQQLANGRWRIDNDTPIPARGDVRVEIVVSPCGDPRRWPSSVEIL